MEYALLRKPSRFCGAILLSPVEFLDEAAFSQLIDEAELDHVLGFEFRRARIGQGLNVERLFQSFEGRVGIVDEQFGVGRVRPFQDIAG